MKSKAYTITEINRYIAKMFSSDFLLNGITIKGEVSNLKYHPTGHLYFTLKDETSQMSAIMFSGSRTGLKFKLENGMQVECRGSIGVYERGGSYQLYAVNIEQQGIGDLYIKYEELKKNLAEMGMFDPIYKKPIPKYASRIGVVTARSGAAVRDIIQISKRRNPYVDIVLYPALVQGDSAAKTIVEGIRTLDEMGLDVIIVGRGGGSIEDLWPFNEEIVAKAVFDAETPIISAVGHETDTTIIDYVSDLRAPTPSAAAELAVYDYRELEQKFEQYRDTLSDIMQEHIEAERQKTAMYTMSIGRFEPSHILVMNRQKAEHLKETLDNLMQNSIRKNRDKLRNYEKMSVIFSRCFESYKHKVSLYAERLEAQSPLAKLSSGYSVTRDAENKRISSVDVLVQGQVVETIVRDGSFKSMITEIERSKKENHGS